MSMDAKINYGNIFAIALMLFTAFMCNVNAAQSSTKSGDDDFFANRDYSQYMVPQQKPEASALTKGTIAGGLAAAFFLMLFCYKTIMRFISARKESALNKVFLGKFSEIQIALHSAESGDPDAQAAIGWMYFKGLNVKKDFKQAYVWLSVSAANGCNHAQKWRDVASKNLSKTEFEDAASVVVKYYERYKKQHL